MIPGDSLALVALLNSRVDGSDEWWLAPLFYLERFLGALKSKSFTDNGLKRLKNQR
ncbi:MAG: hypothetical protein ACOX5F_00285 [Anaerovoracaceae bacterium]|jgi:hypothetical protein